MKVVSFFSLFCVLFVLGAGAAGCNNRGLEMDLHESKLSGSDAVVAPAFEIGEFAEVNGGEMIMTESAQFVPCFAMRTGTVDFQYGVVGNRITFISSATPGAELVAGVTIGETTLGEIRQRTATGIGGERGFSYTIELSGGWHAAWLQEPSADTPVEFLYQSEERM